MTEGNSETTASKGYIDGSRGSGDGLHGGCCSSYNSVHLQAGGSVGDTAPLHVNHKTIVSQEVGS